MGPLRWEERRKWERNGNGSVELKKKRVRVMREEVKSHFENGSFFISIIVFKCVFMIII